VANINGDTEIAAGAILNFMALFPTVIVNSGGVLRTQDLNINPPLAGCPTEPSPTMTILAGDLTIESGGSVNGDTQTVGSKLTNGGAIFIQLSIVGATTGSLVIEPGGELTSNREGGGLGRGGNITVVAEGQINVVGIPGCPADDPTCRGIISANAQGNSLAAFNQGCGRTQITLIATGAGFPNDDLLIDGTVEITFLGEAHIGGVITLIGGGDITNLGQNPPFPSPDPFAGGYPNPGALGNPITFPNPPNADNSAMVRVSEAGIVRALSKDHGGGEIYIDACFVVIEGLVQAGSGREKVLPVLIKIQAHETIIIHAGGQVVADLKEGFRQHNGQLLTDPILGVGRGCEFTPGDPTIQPPANGPAPGTDKGGADICLIARALITIDGTNFLFAGKDGVFGTKDDLFAVSAQTSTSQQTGGTVLVLSTGLVDTGQDASVGMLGNAITTNGGNQGGVVSIQADDNVQVGGVVLARDNTGGGVIHVQAVTGDITGAPGGKLDAGFGGNIRLISCSPVLGFTFSAPPGPATTTPPTAPEFSPGCPPGPGTRVLVFISTNPADHDDYVKQPCQAPFCFCILTLKITQGQLSSITGKDFKAGNNPVVKRVVVDADNCDLTTGTDIDPPGFTVDSPTKITLTPPVAVTSGKYIILRNPGADAIFGNADDPASSCIIVP
jgi:hypothetical protein